MPAPTIIAAIDAGSNAIRSVVSAVSDGALLAPLEVDRVPVRLGHHAFTLGELDDQVISEAVATFARFRKLFDHHGVEHYRAVATSALREASNRELLQDRIYLETGIRLDVIDGEEEGRLVSRAVAQAFEGRAAPNLLLDLGGGSLELSRRGSDEKWRTVSLRVGTVRLLESFGLGDSIDPDEQRMIERFVSTGLANLDIDADWGPGPAVACGGNPEALARILGTQHKGMPKIEIRELEVLLPSLLAGPVAKRMKRFGIPKDRADVIAVAGLILLSAARVMNIRRYRVPGVGIREGLLLDLAEEVAGGHTARGRLQDKVLLASARAFAARVRHDLRHGEHVRRLARSIFDGLRSAFGLRKSDRIYLELAALLHDVGEVIHRRGHHKHSEYLIRYGRVPGILSSERSIIAAIARTHRKSPPDLNKHVTYAELQPAQRELVFQCAAILRLADSLDTDHRQRIKAAHVRVETDKSVHLVLEVADDEPFTPTLHKIEMFVQAFGRPVVEIQRTSASTRDQARRG